MLLTVSIWGESRVLLRLSKYALGEFEPTTSRIGAGGLANDKQVKVTRLSPDPARILTAVWGRAPALLVHRSSYVNVRST